MKIKIRNLFGRKTDPSIKVQVREKLVWNCRSCHRKQQRFTRFCPECLGILQPSLPQKKSLTILGYPREKKEELIQLLKVLTGNDKFDFLKALDALPWLMMHNIDSHVADQWAETLRGENAKLEVSDPAGKLKGKQTKYLFYKENAPLPIFWKAEAENILRKASEFLPPDLRVQWASAVCSAHSVVETVFNRHPYERILFSDLLYQMEEDLTVAGKRIASMQALQNAGELIETIRKRVQQIRAEMEEVRAQVQQQL